MKYYIGVDIGATNIKIGLLDANFKILRKKKLYTPTFSNKEDLIEALVENITLFKKSSKCKIKGVGIGLPGLVNPEKGLVYRLVNISGWNNVYLKKILESRIGLPVFLDNDVNVMTLAEVRCGCARGAKNVVCITLGTGVGGGIVIEGKLYRGATFSAGEIGHIPLNEEGPLCNCGGKGCLERYVGNKYIVAGAVDKIKKAPLPTKIPDLVNNDLTKLTPEILSKACRKGDLMAKEIWQNIARHIGICLAGVVNLLNPEMIVIGGGVAEAGEILFKTIEKTVKERALDLPARTVKIVAAKLKENSGLIGAAVLAKEGLNLD